MPPFGALKAPTPPVPGLAPAAFWQWPALTVLAISVGAALLLSTQYLAQPFVWRNWPWDEVLAGWLEVLRDRIVVAAAIGGAIIAASRLAPTSLAARAAALALAIVAGATLGELALLAGDAPGSPHDGTTMLGHIARWSVIAGSAAGIWYLWRSAAEASAAAQAVELRRAQLDRQATEARIEALRGQIEPHFLFNTLATVRRLQQVEPAQGMQLLAHLIAYMRSGQPAHPGDHDSTLGQEADLVRAYLGVVAQRMHGRLRVTVDVAAELRPRPFPPLTIATLVENAVKHGISPAPGGGSISVSVRRHGAELVAVVADTGVGFSGKSGNGIGLANVRARLNTLYGGAGSLKLCGNSPHGVVATLRLPCSGVPPA